MSYTKFQENQAMALVAGCHNYLDQQIAYTSNNYPTGLALGQDPQTLDKIINLYRLKDMIYTFLADPTASDLGNMSLEHEKSKTINHFLAVHDHLDIINFFNNPTILAAYIESNEFHIKNPWQNIKGLHDFYQKFLQQGSVISNPKK